MAVSVNTQLGSTRRARSDVDSDMADHIGVMWQPDILALPVNMLRVSARPLYQLSSSTMKAPSTLILTEAASVGIRCGQSCRLQRPEHLGLGRRLTVVMLPMLVDSLWIADMLSVELETSDSSESLSTQGCSLRSHRSNRVVVSLPW